MENAFLVYRGRKPTEWEITYNLDLDEQQPRDLESALAVVQVGSLDRPISDEMDSSTLGDTVLPIICDFFLFYACIPVLIKYRETKRKRAQTLFPPI